MNGLLDFINTPAGQGLLTAAFAGMAGARRGAPINTLGAAGLGGIAGYANALNTQQNQAENAIRNKMLALQMKQAEEAQAEKEGMRGLYEQFAQARQPVQQVSPQYGEYMAGNMPQEGFGSGVGGLLGSAAPTQNTGITYGPDPAKMQALEQNQFYQRMMGEAQFKQMFAPQEEYTLTPGAARFRGDKQIASVPQEAKQTDLARLIAERNAFPEGHPAIRLYDSAIQKAATHQPAATATAVSYGTPLPVVNTRTGKTEIIQPTKQGEPPKVLEGYTTPEAAEKAEKTAGRVELANTKADIILGKVGEALKQTKPMTTGFIGSQIGKFPGTEAYDLRETVRTIQANIGFQELQQMREMSPTGGALGQVAVQELENLQATLSSLNPNQSEAQLRSNLNKVDTHYRNWRNAVNKAGGIGNGASGQWGEPPKGAVRRVK